MYAFVRAIGRVPEPLFRSPALCFLRQFEGGGCTVRFPHLRGVAPQSKAAEAALRASHGPRSSGTIFGDEQKSSFPGKEPLGQRKSLPLCADVGERFGQAVNTQQKQIYGHDNV